MPIYRIEPASATAASHDWNLDEATLTEAPVIDDYSAEAARLVERARQLSATPVAHIVGLFASFAERWLDRHVERLRREAPPGVAFGLTLLRQASLDRLLLNSLRGLPAALDGFVRDRSGDRLIAAAPRGLVTHWVAGNVPVLGWLSLVQGILSKNANVVKLPLRHGRVLPWLLARLCAHDYHAPDGSTLSGAEIAAAVLLVYGAADDRGSHRTLSAESDARVIWGGREAIAAVRSLPARDGAEDVVFGPRVSLAVIAREALDRSALQDLAGRLALDASYFDQHGCNSPHTVFVERGGEVTARDFALALSSAMARTLGRIPVADRSAADAFRVASARAEWALVGEVHAPPGPDWTVVVAEGEGLAPQVGCRVVFIRPVACIEDVLTRLDRRIQTVGLAAAEDRARRFATEAARRGIDRIVPPGRMSLYDQPWDGIFVIDRLVRWVTLDL